MNHLSRRHFLKQTPLATTGLLAGRRVLGANESLRIAVIGLGNKGRGHVRHFATLPGVRIAALCDVDPRRLADQAKAHNGAFSHTAPRRIMDRRDIDAVVIATPDHWHAPLAVWACQAGMDVYVEKPVSHNLEEGRQIIAAAARYCRVVQSGTQPSGDCLRSNLFYRRARPNRRVCRW
jgi:predicted dehydrogenase